MTYSHTIYMRGWRAKNRDKLNQKNRNAYAASHELREMFRANARRWGAANKEKVLERVKAWALQNPEKIRIRGRRLVAKRRARIKLVEVLPIDFEAIHKRANGRCGICDQPIDGEFHYDHIMPIALGGAHSTENIQLSHPFCNRSKGARIL